MFFKKNFEYIQQCFYTHTDNFVLLLYFVFFVKSMTIYVLTWLFNYLPPISKLLYINI